MVLPDMHFSKVWLLSSLYEGKAFHGRRKSVSSGNVTIHQKVTRFADFVECDGNHSKYNEAVEHSESFIFLSYFSLLHKGKTWCDVTQHACVINV